LEHQAIGNPKNLNTQPLKIRVLGSVLSDLTGLGVDTAVKLDRQAQLEAVEVYSAVPDKLLPAELHS